MKDILNFMDDLFQSVQTENMKYQPISNDLHSGISLSSRIAMTKTERKDNRYKICVWDPKQIRDNGFPHLVIYLDPYPCGPELTGKSCSFNNTKFDLVIKRINHQNSNGLLKIFINNIVENALRMFEEYDRVVTE